MIKGFKSPLLLIFSWRWYPMGYKKKSLTTKGRSMDRKKRSKEGHERGRGAPKKGNPRYESISVVRKDGVRTHVYRVRK